MQCDFDCGYAGRCKSEATQNGRCEMHANEKCCSCGKPATRECTHTGTQFVCGYPLCDDCEHGQPKPGEEGWFNLGGGHRPKTPQASLPQVAEKTTEPEERTTTLEERINARLAEAERQARFFAVKSHPLHQETAKSCAELAQLLRDIKDRLLQASEIRTESSSGDLLAACNDALIHLESDVTSECPWCQGEGSWTNDQLMQMIPVQHKDGCPILVCRTAIAKATRGQQ